MNKFESSKLKSPESEYEDLIKHYEDLNTQEALKPKIECGSHIKEFETMLTPLLKEKLLVALNTLETEEEALNSEERESANKALTPVVTMLKFLKERTNITEEKYNKLQTKYKSISRAVGIINSGKIDHNR